MTANDNKRGFADGIDILQAAPPPARPEPASPPSAQAKEPAEKKSSSPPRKRLRLTKQKRLKTRHQSFYLPDDQIETLQQLSQQTGRSRTDLVRQAIHEFLQRL